MAKMTKAQLKRMVMAVRSKSFKLYSVYAFTLKDMEAIEKIVDRAMKRLK